MLAEQISYDEFRNLLRHILAEVAINGLPGHHHFYVRFNTGADGVRVSSRLRERFPEQLTIVLQHQFWGLSVTDFAFEVELSFDGVVERLQIPFSAIVAFWDPSAHFMLQLGTWRTRSTEIDRNDRSPRDFQERSESPIVAGETPITQVTPPIDGILHLDRFRKTRS